MERVREAIALQAAPYFMDISHPHGRLMHGGRHHLPHNAVVLTLGISSPARDWDAEAAGIFTRRAHEVGGDRGWHIHVANCGVHTDGYHIHAPDGNI